MRYWLIFSTSMMLSCLDFLKEDVEDFLSLVDIMEELRSGVEETIVTKYKERVIKSLVVKLKFSDFTQTTAERAPEVSVQNRGIRPVMESNICRQLLEEAWGRSQGKGVRLVGVGVRFADAGSKSQLQFDL